MALGGHSLGSAPLAGSARRPEPDNAGALQAQGAAVAGSGSIVRVGAGALVGGAAGVAGVGASITHITGVGALAADRAAIEGVGYVVTVADGALTAGPATIAGAGEIIRYSILGSGDLEADPSAIAGAGSIARQGSGALDAGAATLAGAGRTYTVITGDGALAAGVAALAGLANAFTPLAPAQTETIARPRLLSDPLPQRRTTQMAEYREDRVIPWAYGRVTIEPIPLDEDGREWLLADHAIVAVDRVMTDGQPTDGWQLVQRTDSTDHPIATLRLTQPPESGEVLTVALTGKRDRDSGEPIEHPADVVRDLLTECGWELPVGTLAGLREDYPGVAIGGVIDDAPTLRGALRGILDGLGADWTATPLTARRAGPREPVAVLGVRELDDVSAESTSQTLATVLRVTYAADAAAGKPRGALTVEAPEAIERYGRIERDLSMPWVRTGRDATEIATRRLERLARPEWRIDATTAWRDQPWAPGDTITLGHPRVPGGDAVITGLDADPDSQRLVITLRLAAGDTPRVEVTGRAVAIDPAAESPLGVTYSNGRATFTITDDTGQPIAGASVTLDGQQTRTTSRNGQVQFTTPRGPHTLTVTADGYAAFEMDVIV